MMLCISMVKCGFLSGGQTVFFFNGRYNWWDLNVSYFKISIKKKNRTHQMSVLCLSLGFGRKPEHPESERDTPMVDDELYSY